MNIEWFKDEKTENEISSASMVESFSDDIFEQDSKFQDNLKQFNNALEENNIEKLVMTGKEVAAYLKAQETIITSQKNIIIEKLLSLKDPISKKEITQENVKKQIDILTIEMNQLESRFEKLNSLAGDFFQKTKEYFYL